MTRSVNSEGLLRRLFSGSLFRQWQVKGLISVHFYDFILLPFYGTALLIVDAQF